MQNTRFLLAALSAVLLSSGVGCYSLGSDCAFNYSCEGGGGGGTSTGGGGGGGAPPGCIPSNNSTPVASECGVFVSSTRGDDANAGNKEKPFATITMAMSAAGGKPIYLCGETLLETVQIDGGATLYGALDCASDWAYDPSKQTILNASGDMVPVSVSSGAKLSMYDVAVLADDALIPGGSSIAILASSDAEVSLTRCKVEAGSGMNGDGGEMFADPALEGQDGVEGVLACQANQTITGEPPTNPCGGMQSIGGGGGVGMSNGALPGGPGEPQGSMNGGQAEGVATACTDGGPGDPGMSGTPGDGATSFGSLGAGVGFTGVAGADGNAGAPGQGGGGGGGAKGGAACNGQPGTGGASGGTGASGGCGGQGGKGGKGGGASIGIASLGAKLTFSDVTIETRSGGAGGNGGPGQTGGPGGIGGIGGSKGAAGSLKNGCAGGDGGKGGDGGQGGGGRGGHSIGIAHTGAAPDTTGVTITVGAAGNGGLGEGATGSGAPGVAEKVHDFN